MSTFSCEPSCNDGVHLCLPYQPFITGCQCCIPDENNVCTIPPKSKLYVCVRGIRNSAWKFSLVRSLGLQGLGPRPRPVPFCWNFEKTRLNSLGLVHNGFYSYKTSLNQLWLRPVANWSQTSLVCVVSNKNQHIH